MFIFAKLCEPTKGSAEDGNWSWSTPTKLRRIGPIINKLKNASVWSQSMLLYFRVGLPPSSFLWVDSLLNCPVNPFLPSKSPGLNLLSSFDFCRSKSNTNVVVTSLPWCIPYDSSLVSLQNLNMTISAVYEPGMFVFMNPVSSLPFHLSITNSTITCLASECNLFNSKSVSSVTLDSVSYSKLELN